MPTLLLDCGPKPGCTGVLGTTLREYGHRTKVVRVAPATGTADPLPPDLDDVDAIVLADGPQTLASAPPAWAERAMELVREAHARQTPILGLGFGARLLAKALGGELAAEPCTGWLETTLSPVGREDPLFKGLPWTLGQVLWQQESIAKLPDGATPYATSAGAPGRPKAVRGFSAGVFAFGFEHQWWLDGAAFEMLVGSRRDLGDASALHAAWKTHGAMSMHYGRRIAESVALYLMPIDRVNAGRVKDLHY
jgi:GMP synthase-like glutamine amidotransferase